jgi:hypothetical protein
VKIIMQIMNGIEMITQDFTTLEEVMKIPPGVITAGITRA